MEKYEIDSVKEEIFPATDDVIKIYLHDISHFPTLSKEEEQSLFQKYQMGEESVKESIVEHNLKLVFQIALRYQGHGLSLSDLIQEGNIALLKSIDKFNVDLGYRFSTYATWWISQSMARAIMNYGKTIRLPVHVHEKISAIRRKEMELQQKLGREPSMKELSLELNCSVKYLKNLLHYQYDVFSYHELIEKDSDDEMLEVLPDDGTDLENTALSHHLYEELMVLFQKCNLSEKEIKVLILHEGLGETVPKTFQEIGNFMGVSKQYIEQIYNRSFAKNSLEP